MWVRPPPGTPRGAGCFRGALAVAKGFVDGVAFSIDAVDGHAGGVEADVLVARGGAFDGKLDLRSVEVFVLCGRSVGGAAEEQKGGGGDRQEKARVHGQTLREMRGAFKRRLEGVRGGMAFRGLRTFAPTAVFGGLVWQASVGTVDAFALVLSPCHLAQGKALFHCDGHSR